VSFTSLSALVATSMLTTPTPHDTLSKFYSITRPFGLWSPVRRDLPEDVRAGIRREHLRDLVALAAAIPWQLTLFLFTMQIVMKQWVTVAWLGVLLAGLSLVLVKTLLGAPALAPVQTTHEPQARP